MNELTFIVCIILYWFAEGVTEGYTWNRHDDLWLLDKLDYHAWRIVENVGIWGAVIISMFLDFSFGLFWTGVGAWLIGASIYEMTLNYIVFGTIYKPKDFKWHILGYNIKWITGKVVWVLFWVGVTILVYGVVG